MTAQQEKDSSTTVKFNVGGRIYEVSKSLLEGFPDTMLAKQASSSSPVFIDRDPDRFAFCLDYMRDNGLVHLPETVSSMAVRAELKYFGFDDIDETKILSDEKSQRNCVVRCNQITEAIKRQIAQMEKELEPLELDVNRRKEEIGMQKVALKCRAHSVESTAKRFSVSYSEVKGLVDIHKNQYFIECCDKLGLCVDGPGFSASHYRTASDVYLTRKHEGNIEG